MSTDGDPAAGRVLPALERGTFRAESPLRRLLRSNRLNPLPHAGTISIVLLIVVVVTGVYLTMFFGFGFEASYAAVRRLHEHPIGSVVRSVHRVASAALVLTTLVHAWRMFVAGRFRGPRRWRWTTGVAALVLVWLAGVTGYWLVWDRRAAALNEATLRVAGWWGPASRFLVRHVYGSGAGTGWPVLFALWTVHLLLTAVIGWFLWRHVRRSHLGWRAPRHWVALMIGALVLVALVVPAELLGPADAAGTVADMPLDPFVLFLLPTLLSGAAWPAMAVMSVVIAAALWFPHLRRRSEPVAVVDEGRCTGCELCVIDCPYLAVSLRERPGQAGAEQPGVEGTQPRRQVAVVDAAACVGCGICLGSCSFGALSMPGVAEATAAPPPEVAGKRVVLACARHLSRSGAAASLGDGVVVIENRCTGMIHAGTVGSLLQAGAAAVQVVGCPPGDCAFGVGNELTAERLAGSRAPHPPRRYVGAAAEDYVAPGELAAAVAGPGGHHHAEAASTVRDRRLVGAAAVVGASILAVAAATRTPYRAGGAEASVRLVIDHAAGRQLVGQPAPSGALDQPVLLSVERDGEELARHDVPNDGGVSVAVVDLDVPPGTGTWVVRLTEGDTQAELYRADTTLDAGRRLVVEALDTPPPPGVDEGREVFTERNLGGCVVCHSTEHGEDRVGPSLAGVADRAATRVPAMSAEEYLRTAVLDPDAYVVEGYRAGQMLPIYAERLSPAQIDAVVAYLLSLTEGGGAGS
ncbi:MAG: hydrogenase iron-sulfur subunit [Acidimicrobiia bacterium]